jgi:hypothetical protein
MNRLEIKKETKAPDKDAASPQPVRALPRVRRPRRALGQLLLLLGQVLLDLVAVHQIRPVRDDELGTHNDAVHARDDEAQTCEDDV